VVLDKRYARSMGDVAARLRAHARLKNTISLTLSQKCSSRPTFESNRPRRRATAWTRPATGTAHRTHVMGDSEARGWRRGAPLPSLGWSSEGLEGVSQTVRSDEFVELVPAGSNTPGRVHVRDRRKAP